jgi:uncharacterized protein YbaR (Trm112 family)
MKIPESLVALLRCPENHQGLALADPDTLLELNKNIARNQVSNRGGAIVESEIEAGLIRADGKRLYPVREGFPIMLLDEAIDLV